MFKRLIKNLSNPLLFYVNKSGQSVFRNYCLLRNDGCLYKETFSIQEAGKILEYRMELDKKLNFFSILFAFLAYFILINLNINLWSILFCEFLWIIAVFCLRIYFSFLYSKHLENNLGVYEIIEFHPNISKEKTREFYVQLRSKIALILVVITLFMVPSVLLQKCMKWSLASKNPKYKLVISASKLYSSLYPKSVKVYDMSALSKYIIEDYTGSLNDYKSILKMTGKKFDKKDITRFANLLYIEKKIYGSQDAIDAFNEYATRKKLSVLEESQLLWIKSMFSIKNNMPETVITDYDTLLSSLPENDNRNRFYISCDKAYMLYLMGEYHAALKLYNALIKFASKNRKKYCKELQSLYAERGFTKKNLGDASGAIMDFKSSNIDEEKINAYEPSNSRQGFIVEKY